MKNIEHVKSTLKLDSLYFNNISFKKNNEKYNGTEEDCHQISFSKNLVVSNDDSFTIRLKTKVETTEYELMMELTGVFCINGGLNDNNSYFEKNAIAIMFPYLRSQLTLLTTQPGIKPVMLPPVNINELLK